jgi:hypothetical protein
MLLVAAPSEAATYVFSYTFAGTGNTVMGSVEGALAADNNTFNITGLDSYSVNGIDTNAINVNGTDQR